jgi:thermitase
MQNRPVLRFLFIVVLGISAGFLAHWLTRTELETSLATAPAPAPVEEPDPAVPESTPESRRAGRMALTEEKLMRKLRQALQRKDARPNEVILSFRDAQALRRFLERAGKCGVSVLKQLDKLNLLRVQVDDLAAFEADLNANGGDFADLDANLLVFPPTVPEQDERIAATQAPFREGLREFLGMSGDSAQWGIGVTVAVIDSGVGADATFGAGKVRYLDVGMGVAPTGDDGHGTGVAALVSGRAADAMGVAPGADILSIRVTGADGLSDGFTLMQAITAAADNGARVINVSLGAYGSSPGLSAAIEYAKNLGAVIVASAGNDQVNQLTWPAAHPGVISVGAVDAGGKQVIFSNSGEGLSLTAPGYGVPTAWTNNQRVYADGTSFSAPIVSGSIAALMSIYNTNAVQAATILQQTASDGGPLGMDPDYGNGTVNMMWAQHYNDPTWFDTAISSHYVNPVTGNLDVIVQNRGSIGVSGMQLDLSVNGNSQGVQLPWMSPGSRHVTSIPISANELTEKGRLDFKTTLTNPQGQNDGVPSNNFKGSSLSVAK